MKSTDLTGQRFGRWTVQSLSSERTKSRGKIWHCLCECGTQRLVPADRLLRLKSRSCGCLDRELTAQRSTKHGLYKHSAYRSWQGMMHRCNNPKHNSFPQYGGRGITVCERWHSVENFIADMGEKPSRSHSIERKDNNKGYSPSNCEWATPLEQARNRSSTRWVIYNGTKMTLAEAAEAAGLNRTTLHSRFAKGWSEDDLFKPLGYRRAANPTTRRQTTGWLTYDHG